MKRGILLLILTVLLSSLVSAGLFSGVWEDYLTGRQVQDVSSADLTINEKPYFLKPGDSLVIDGETVKLITITSDGSISVSVGGLVGVGRLGYGHIGLDVKGKIFYISINKLIYNGKELSIVSVERVCIDSDNSNPNIINGGLKDLDNSVYIKGEIRGLDFDGNFLETIDRCGFTPKGGDPSYPGNILQYSISGPYLVEQFCCPELNISLKGRICASTKSCPNGCEYGACISYPSVKECPIGCVCEGDVVSCPVITNETNMVKEQVKCIFDDSKTIQKCYVANLNSGCSGVESCAADVYGVKGSKLIWKSSCGGYAYTVIDGINEYAKFGCAPSEIVQPTEDVIPIGNITSCPIGCICEGDTISCPVTPEENKTSPGYIGPPLPICNGCLVDSKCLPYGNRLEGQYCDISGNFVQQKELKGSCENNYECRSNECADGECINTAGLLQKLLDFLSKIFGK